MQFGLQLSPYRTGTTGNPWNDVAPAARIADTSGFDSLWLYDHFLYEGGYSAHPISEPVLECFTVLGALAAITGRIRLGPLVAGVPYRNPALTTKMATTLDQVSRGRLILGLGAGWHAREYEAYGWGKLESAGVRLARLEEAIGVTLALWTERPARFEGAYYRLADVLENPPPIQKPHPPILIGGNGERGTLSLAARYGQFCNVAGDPDEVGHLFGVLQQHCRRSGRPYDQVTRSIYTTVLIGRDDADVAAKRDRLRDSLPWEGALIGTPDQLIARFREYAEVGCRYAILRMPDWADLEPIELFAERVIPALDER